LTVQIMLVQFNFFNLLWSKKIW